MADPNKYAQFLRDPDQQALDEFNRIEASGQQRPWWQVSLPMEGRSFLGPIKNSLEGSVFNQKEWALPGFIAGPLNILSSFNRATTGSDPNFDPYKEAIDVASGIMGGGISTSSVMKSPMGQGGKNLALNAYHGTPHEIKGGFDIRKVGIGEGNQSYGHGMYFAENPEVSRSYMTAGLSTKATDRPTEFIIRAKEATNSDEAAKQFLQKRLENATEDVKPYLKEALDKFDSFKTGNLYKVDIPDEQIPMMLDWDKPVNKELLSKITPENLGLQIKKFDDGLGYVTDNGTLVTRVKQGKAKEVTEEMLNNSFNDSLKKYASSGQNLYGWLVPGNAPEASKILSNAGITGIRYLDEGSRSAGKGSSNFVVFDPKTVKILEKNDVPVDRKELLQEQFDKLSK